MVPEAIGWHAYESGPRPRASRLLRLATTDTTMLTTIAFILLALWLLGLVSSYTIGGFIHVLLLVAIVLFIINVMQGRRPVS
jgi:Family of unknown function (DUF5670)